MNKFKPGDIVIRVLEGMPLIFLKVEREFQCDGQSVLMAKGYDPHTNEENRELYFASEDELVLYDMKGAFI